ncbi:hypothetical protein EVAR_31644_1 [Eumeta japonica]|uniref:Uncharacterized protein n=1 Tax=Eumeta variegata TaxID=151549 RepID=A0A4C1W018_EUMVA|nr:hypothetical protein EVAR_31644_1 [Eumeta japonica]
MSADRGPALRPRGTTHCPFSSRSPSRGALAVELINSVYEKRAGESRWSPPRQLFVAGPRGLCRKTHGPIRCLTPFLPRSLPRTGSPK